MNSKNVIITWNKDFFDNSKRLLPDTTKLCTQIHNPLKNRFSWTIVFEFAETARQQGYISMAKAYFLVKDAPHDILRDGYRFDFLDGNTVIGICEVVG